jgi:pimeloyl-ACP methyl ester carboxylesterase
MLPENKIQIAERPPSAVYQKPENLSGLASRLNNPSGNIRIESYASPQGRVLVVYLPGTAEWNPLAKEKAFDVRSDVELLGTSEKSSSYRAANAALSAFGAKETDRLILVGYSQGGMIAADLAQQDRNVIGVVTMGAPIANETLPSGLPVISLEHSNDVVPTLAGATNPITENWATATRHVELDPGENVLKAHNMSEYVATANLADSSTDAGLVRLRGELFREINECDFVAAKEYAPLKAAS